MPARCQAWANPLSWTSLFRFGPLAAMTARFHLIHCWHKFFPLASRSRRQSSRPDNPRFFRPLRSVQMAVILQRWTRQGGRKSVVYGTSVEVRVELGGGRLIKKKKQRKERQ